MSGPDLHLHSTYSDGLLTPAELVGAALSLGLPAIAIADHDSVGGIEPAIRAAHGTGLVIVPAVELSSDAGERTAHILGYHIDHTDGALLERLAVLRSSRLERAERILGALARDGIELDPATVATDAHDAAVGRAHIARALVAAGHAHDMRDAFGRFVGDSAPYFAAKTLVTPEEAIGWVTDAGGVAVLAHPGLSHVDDLIPALVDAGLSGIEACHASHDAYAVERYAAIANASGLIVTGGSDYHGSTREGGAMGCACAPPGALEALAAAAALRKGQQ